MHDILHVLGLTNGSGRWYLFWSGIVGDVALIGAGYAIVRRHNCHTKKCWRLGRHTDPKTGYTLCLHHHKQLHGVEGKLTFEKIKEHHDKVHMTNSPS